MKIITNLEQWSKEWLNVRKGVITWTKLKWITWWDKAQDTAMYELIADKYLVEEDLRPYEIIERWHILEIRAKLVFEEHTWKTVTEVWFIERDEFQGLSPDGIIETTPWIYWESLEIKCPRGKNYVKYLIEDILPKEYEPQVLNYFMVMEDLETLYFMMYNPDTIWPLKKFHIITVTREQLQDKINKAEEKLETFKAKRTKWIETLLNK